MRFTERLQDNAISLVLDQIKLAKSGIRPKPNQPLSSFLFVGPTGVGKTEMAKALAKAIYGTPNALIRFDMGQYSEEHTVNNIMGPPASYVGSDKGGQLTQAVKKLSGNCVVLLDEIEKAHPKLFDPFLTLLDEGYMTDNSFGEKIDCTKAIIVLTSNLFSSDAQSFQSLDQNNLRKTFEKATTNTSQGKQNVFRPEFLGRLKKIVPFAPLSPESLMRIFDSRLRPVLKSLRDNGISVRLSGDFLDHVRDKLQTVDYGVRQIDDFIEGLTIQTLKQEFPKGTNVIIECEGNEIKFIRE